MSCAMMLRRQAAASGEQMYLKLLNNGLQLAERLFHALLHGTTPRQHHVRLLYAQLLGV